MSKQATSPPTTTHPRREGRGGAGHRQLVVAEYVGHNAAQAAQALRRAGLRPGLERSLDSEPELLGRVIAQEPPAGSQLARNAMVTLYVGAASTPPGDDDSYERSTEAAMSSELAEPFVVESTPRQSAQTRRRRKPRPVERRPQISDSTDCVAPAMLPEADTTEYLVSHEGPSAATPGDDQLPEEDIDDGYGERRHHELVARVDDVFSGRAGAPWRRVYPVRRRAISFGNQHHRRWTR